MVLENLFCGLCGERDGKQAALLGRCHGYQQATIRTDHFRGVHPHEYQELRDRAAELRDLKKRYHGYNLIGLHN